MLASRTGGFSLSRRRYNMENPNDAYFIFKNSWGTTAGDKVKSQAVHGFWMFCDVLCPHAKLCSMRRDFST